MKNEFLCAPGDMITVPIGPSYMLTARPGGINGTTNPCVGHAVLKELAIVICRDDKTSDLLIMTGSCNLGWIRSWVIQRVIR